MKSSIASHFAVQMYGVNTAEAMELLENFLAMNPDSE